MRALPRPLIVASAIFLFVIMTAVHAQGDQLGVLNWQHGPTIGTIDSKATIIVPEGYTFLDNVDTKKLMVMMENIPGDNQYVFAPSDLRWFSVFEFNGVGYVKDDETLDTGSLRRPPDFE